MRLFLKATRFNDSYWNSTWKWMIGIYTSFLFRWPILKGAILVSGYFKFEPSEQKNICREDISHAPLGFRIKHFPGLPRYFSKRYKRRSAWQGRRINGLCRMDHVPVTQPFGIIWNKSFSFYFCLEYWLMSNKNLNLIVATIIMHIHPKSLTVAIGWVTTKRRGHHG